MQKILLLLFMSTMIISGIAQDNYCFPVQTHIETGPIEGLYDTRTGMQYYLGIPYAKPPVGALRWKAPQPMDPWITVRETKQFGSRPIQAPVFDDMVFRSPGLSEDCLYLNIWTPAKSQAKNLPVLVYFHGGGNVAGDGSEPRYDGAQLAKKGIVVVTINYRLNIFGFFAHPELSAEAPYKASGNYGMLDQSAALQWVQRNIAAFGGDPKRVTIAGESAGSIGVSYQMSSPLSKHLIAGAIGESGAGIPPTLAAIPLAEAEQIGLDFAKKAGIPSLEALRALSTQELYALLQEGKGLRFPVVIDHYFLHKPIAQVFAAKEQAQVPLLLGWNAAEIPGTAFMYGQPYTEASYIARVKETYPKDYEAVLKLYPYSTPKEIEWSATALASDRFIAYSTWKWFDLQRTYSTQPVYRYLYCKRRPPQQPGAVGGESATGPEPIGAPHACEIEYAMGNLHLNKVYAWTADDYKVSDTILGFFTNFIKTGNPNGATLPAWPAATPNDPNPPVMVIDTISQVLPSKIDARYRLMDTLSGN